MHEGHERLMQDLLDLFSLAFMQRAIIAGLAIAIMAGILGTFIVQRGLAFLGDGLAHASFGGIALGALIAATTGNTGLLQQPLVIAVPFTILVALGIAFVRDRTRLASDTVIGVFFAVTVALAVLFVSIIPPERSTVDVWSLLFGSILAVTRVDLAVILAVFVVAVLALVRLWPRLAYSTFDSQLAQTDGVNVRRLEYLLFMLAALITVVSAQVVGVVLMAAYLVIPAAAARLLSSSLIGMTLRSVSAGLVTTVSGLLLSFYLDVPSGSMIILSQAALFIAAAVLRKRN
jgi:zinc transport system permease protein